MDASRIYIGTAGWTIPKDFKSSFPEAGTHLERYSQSLNCVEINSSFYREHKHETYVKWAASTPENFKFSVKLSKSFIQEQRLKETGSRLQEVLDGISGLGSKWGALLVQLPPSLEFEAAVAENFIKDLKKRSHPVPILWEPRHRSWTSEKAVSLLAAYGISKVLADPEPCPLAKGQRLNLEKIRYFRLHGSPEIYKSRYPEEIITRLQKSILSSPASTTEVWCIFDNTTFGYATENALQLRANFIGSDLD